MVFFHDFFGNIDIEPVVCNRRPRQPQQPIQIGTDYTAFRRHRRHLFQPFDFFGDFFGHVLGQVLLTHLLPILFDFGCTVIFFAQLLLDRFHLLAQKVFFLSLFHLFADTPADFLFDLENFHFTVNNFRQQVEALPNVDCRQQFLLIFQFQRHVAENQVGQAIGIIDQKHRGNRLRRHFFAQFRPLFKLMR